MRKVRVKGSSRCDINVCLSRYYRPPPIRKARVKGMNCWKALRNRRLFLEKLRSSMNDLVIAPCLGWPRSLCENFMWLSMAVPSSERRPSFRLGYGLTDRPALHFQYYFSVRASGTETEQISWVRISVGRSPRCCEIISWIYAWRVSSPWHQSR
jgi:hypothetical protein